jgi:hypothetical protein
MAEPHSTETLDSVINDFSRYLYARCVTRACLVKRASFYFVTLRIVNDVIYCNRSSVAQY